MFDLSHLAQPIDSQSPCGPDCEYDNDFLALSQAVAGKPEQQFGETVIAAVEPDWRAVEQMASELLGRTKDLRVVGWLTQAATHLHGISGFAAGVGLMQMLCMQYWEEVHPRMVIDGESDPFLRMNALAELSGGGGSFSGGSEILRALRAAVLANRGFPITVRDTEAAVLKDPAAPYAEVQIIAVLTDAIAEGSEAVAAYDRSLQSITALIALVEERMATSDQPDFSELKALNKAVAGTIARARAAGIVEDPQDNASESPDADGSAGGPGQRASGGVTGDIRSREDVRRALNRLCDYLERHEPSNPASLFARRAERMLDMGFLDIMQELSPDAISHLQMLTGAKAQDGS